VDFQGESKHTFVPLHGPM